MIEFWPLLPPLVFILTYVLIREKGHYRRGRNPAHRVCRDCGQNQHAYSNSPAPGAYSWWEPNGRIINPKCKCHKDTQ